MEKEIISRDPALEKLENNQEAIRKFMEQKGYEDCPMCHDAGYMYLEEKKIECDKCDGLGFVKTGKAEWEK